MNLIPKLFRRSPSKSDTTLSDLGKASANATLIGDNPIRLTTQDTLSRSQPARAFARHVLSLDAREGVVVGVLGPWGSGKTSFVNLARLELAEAKIPVLDFNPWMFSGAEQLVDAFFSELSVQLKLRPKTEELGKKLEEYGEALAGIGWLPVVGPWFEHLRSSARVIAGVMQKKKKEGIGGLRARVEKALNALGSPIVVVLDDIDRLTAKEIRDIFKLVRLTASFPNMIYLVAFDRVRVETALTEDGVPGRAYLEKILQLGVDLPDISATVLHKQIFAAIDEALRGVYDVTPVDQNVWPDVFFEIIRPLVRNMRDVRRYALAINWTVRDIGSRIALADILALEAIRVFLPDIFMQLPRSLEALTTTSRMGQGLRPEPMELKQQVEGLIQLGGKNGTVVRAMIMRLFPAAQRHVGGSHFGSEWTTTWLRGKRVASESILRLYLERVVGEGLLVFYSAEDAWARLGDRTALETYFGAMDPSIIPDVVASLEMHEQEFQPRQVIPGSIVLLNLIGSLPHKPRGMFDIGETMIIVRVVFRLLRSLKDPVEIERAISAILPELSSLSAKSELISCVGHRENAGSKIVPEAVASRLEQEWRAEVRAASVEELLIEPKLLLVILLAIKESGPSEPSLEIPDDPRLTASLLRSASGEVLSNVMGNRAVSKSQTLAWVTLVKICGGEDSLRRRIDHLKATAPTGMDDLLQLADKYLDGWRPDDD